MAYYFEDQFKVIDENQKAMDVFKASIGRIELETHSYCNRRCGYCPNVTGDRLGPNIRIKETIFEQIVKDLKNIDYEGILVLNRYNEPLYDRDILKRISKFSETIPKADLQVFTNGDYLDPNYLNELSKAGLKKIFISIHMNPADVYSDIYALNRIEEIATRIALRPKYKTCNSNTLIIADFLHPSLKIEARAINYWKHGQNRGGLIDGIKETYVRKTPCHFPFFHLHIGYTGNIVPCCHIRSDREEHKNFRIGNVRDFPSLYLAYTSPIAVNWRKSIADFQEKNPPCKNCDAAFLDGSPDTLKKYQNIFSKNISRWLTQTLNELKS